MTPKSGSTTKPKPPQRSDEYNPDPIKDAKGLAEFSTLLEREKKKLPASPSKRIAR